jgi:hypothetical protein
MPTPRKILCRCSCGWEHELDVDLDVDPPLWIYQCPAPGCGAINNVTMAFDVETRRKRWQGYQPSSAPPTPETFKMRLAE